MKIAEITCWKLHTVIRQADLNRRGLQSWSFRPTTATPTIAVLHSLPELGNLSHITSPGNGGRSLAFLLHTILDLSDRLYQLLRTTRGRHTRFFQELGESPATGITPAGNIRYCS